MFSFSFSSKDSNFPFVVSNYTWGKLAFVQNLKGTVIQMSGALSLCSFLLSCSLFQNSRCHSHPELSPQCSKTALFCLGFSCATVQSMPLCREPGWPQGSPCFLCLWYYSPGLPVVQYLKTVDSCILSSFLVAPVKRANPMAISPSRAEMEVTVPF